MFEIVKSYFCGIIHNSSLPKSVITYKETDYDIHDQKAESKDIKGSNVTTNLELVFEEGGTESNR